MKSVQKPLSDNPVELKEIIIKINGDSIENHAVSQLDSQYQTVSEVLLQLPFYPVRLIALLYG